MSARHQVLNLYKVLIRESQKFAAYNYRCYAVRRVRDAFRDNKAVTDPDQLKSQIAEAYRNLEIIKRQAIISRMYEGGKLVIEHLPKQ